MLTVDILTEPTGEIHIGDPDLRIVIVARDGAVVGRLCAHVNTLLSYNGATPGLIGWYECADDPEASRALLDAAVRLLKERGCATVIGPINGDTWHRYRVALPSDEPPFFLDLVSEPWHSAQWRDAGFAPIAEYLSTEITVADVDFARIEDGTAMFLEKGVTIRKIDPLLFESELALIHDIACRSFDWNFLYTPITLEEFVALYRPVLPVVRPELVELAFDSAGEPVAFCFALPDLLAPAGSRVIAKTAGKVPRDDLRGLGSHLIERVHCTARALGCTSVIHALMYATNRSRNVLGDIARPIRRYELYSM
jgi:hypothetical protein